MGDKISLKQKIELLDNKIEWFYSDEFDLAKAEEKYKESTELAKEIEKDLSELKNKIEVLAEDFSK